jgi:Asp/Glu/hydantoin racemase
MKTVVAVYTGQGLADPLKDIFQEVLPEVRLVNLIDDGLIHDINRAGNIGPGIRRRLFRYYRNAEELGADVILNTCSSVGEIVALAQPMISVPIVRIDDAMATLAVENFERIGVVATLASTLTPTVNLIQSKAELGQKPIKMVEGLAEGAYLALIGGNGDEHDRRIMEAARRLKDEVDVLVLAQGSMARMQERLAMETGKPVLSSIRAGIAEVGDWSEGANGGGGEAR